MLRGTYESKAHLEMRLASKCLCYEEEFDEMKRTCAYCGMFEDEGDILVRCQGTDCSLRSADYELPGVFHGRCAAALGHSGGAQWQNCPWCPPAKPVTVIGVEVSDEDENFISMTRLEESGCKRSCGRSGDALWRVYQWEPAPRKRRSLKAMKSTLKAVEKEWRMLFNEELANLELDLCVRSRRVEW